MPDSKRFFFITTNYCWGASEFLWYDAIKQLYANKTVVFAYIPKFHHSAIESLQKEIGQQRVFNSSRYQLLRFYKRWINKLYPLFIEKDTLKEMLTKFKPDLVIVSKGNAFGDEEIPIFLKQNGFKYIIVNHLVSESSWPLITELSRLELIEGVQFSLKNYFVSNTNKMLFEKMIGAEISNAEVVFNPIENKPNLMPDYPDIHNGFSAAIVGRLECFHKGIDILIDVVKESKWQTRDITFNIYGNGPHRIIIENLITKHNIQNIKLHGYVTDKTQIWQRNHILILPSRMEGQSISLSEALNFKRTVVGTNVGGISEYIDDNITGFISQFANKFELDEAMERAWNRRTEWAEMGIKANEKWKEKAPAYPIENFIQRIFNLITTL